MIHQKNIDKLKYAKGVSRKSFSWLTDDAHEFALRRERGLKEPMTVKRVAQKHKIFTTFEVRRADIHDAATYSVEIRSLNERLNYCDCPDYYKNFLGTCKHVEKVLANLGASASKTANSPFVEIFIDHADGDLIRIMRPRNLPGAVEKFLHTYLNEAGNIRIPEFETLSVLVADLEKLPQNVKTAIRVSSSVHKWLYGIERRLELEKMKKLCGDKFRSHGGCANFLKHHLYDYQIEGMLHLAFRF
jgi:hypothetical protein